MSELQVGGLVLIIGARYEVTQVNIGKMAEVVSIEPGGEVIVKSDSIVDKFGGSVDQALCLRTHLLPIKPECDPLDVTHKEELHA
jgi:hypothetical protein